MLWCAFPNSTPPPAPPAPSPPRCLSFWVSPGLLSAEDSHLPQSHTSSLPQGQPTSVTVGCRDIKTGTCCLRVQSFKELPSPDLLWDQLSSLLWMHHSSTLPNLTSSSPSSLKTCQVLSGPDLIQLALGLAQGSRVTNGILDPCWAAGNEDIITSDRWDSCSNCH